MSKEGLRCPPHALLFCNLLGLWLCVSYVFVKGYICTPNHSFIRSCDYGYMHAIADLCE